MKYKEAQKQFTDIIIPQAWEKAVEAEKTAELLVYSIMVQCMDNFSDVSIELASDNPINAVLRSWSRNENSNFGTNAIFLTPKDDGGLILGCTYDIWKLRDDVDVIASNMFGTLNLDKVGEKVIEADVEIPDDDIRTLFAGIQKKKIQIRGKKEM